jgi:ketosteroid isomerase-like protein
VVKDFLAALGSGENQALQSVTADDIEWVIPGKDWPLAGTYHGHAGVAALGKKASESIETKFSRPPEFVAEGDRVLVIGVATGTIKATGKSFEDHWVFDITVRAGKVARLVEYVDTQALATAAAK